MRCRFASLWCDLDLTFDFVIVTFKIFCSFFVRLSVHPAVRPQFRFRDTNSKTVCPIEFKLDRDIDHHHS